MKFNTDPIVKTAKDVEALARKISTEGRSFIQTTLDRLPLFSSVMVDTSDDEKSTRDETHYFLIPNPSAPERYVMYSSRRLPPDYAEVNDLPKVRVFHLPGPGAESLLEDLLHVQLTAAKSAGKMDGESPLADRLNRIGEEIDKQTNRVSGGLLIIGSAVALANPLLGIGIAAKALLPGIGSILSKQGLQYAGEKIKGWQKTKKEKDLRKETQADLNAMEIEHVVNPLLQALDRTFSTSHPDYDPLTDFEFDHFVVEGELRRDLLVLSARAVNAVYQDLQGMKDEAMLEEKTYRFLEMLRSFE